jgi:hypothetical protein
MRNPPLASAAECTVRRRAGSGADCFDADCKRQWNPARSRPNAKGADLAVFQNAQKFGGFRPNAVETHIHVAMNQSSVA